MLTNVCQNKQKTTRAVPLGSHASPGCPGSHIKFHTMLMRLVKHCLPWTLCFLLKWSCLCLSSQVFVPVARSWSFVPSRSLVSTTRRPAWTPASDRSVKSIPQHTAVYTMGSSKMSPHLLYSSLKTSLSIRCICYLFLTCVMLTRKETEHRKHKQ